MTDISPTTLATFLGPLETALKTMAGEDKFVSHVMALIDDDIDPKSNSDLLVNQIDALTATGNWAVTDLSTYGAAQTVFNASPTSGQQNQIQINVGTTALADWETAEAFVGVLAYELGHAEDPELNQIQYGNNALSVGAEVALNLLGEGKSLWNEIQAEQNIQLKTAGVANIPIMSPMQAVYIENTNAGNPQQAILLGGGVLAVDGGASTAGGEQTLYFYWSRLLGSYQANLGAANPTVMKLLASMNMKSASSVKLTQNTTTQAIAMAITLNANANNSVILPNGSSVTVSSYKDTFGGTGTDKSGGYGMVAPSGTAGGQANPQLITPSGSQAFNFTGGGYLVDAYNPYPQTQPYVAEEISIYSSGSYNPSSYQSGKGVGLSSDTLNFVAGYTVAGHACGSELITFDSYGHKIGQFFSGANATGNQVATVDDPSTVNVTFDENAFDGQQYNSLSSTEDVTLSYYDPTIIGTLVFNVDTGADSITLVNGITIDLPGVTDDVISAPTDPAETPEQTLLDYLSDLGDPLSASDLTALNFAYLNPTGMAYDATSVVSGKNVIFGTEGAITPGATITGLGTLPDGQNGTPINIISVGGTDTDLAQDSITDIDELDATGGGNVTLTNDEFTSFGTIIGSGTITAADGGTFDLTADNVDQNSGFTGLVATGWDGTTLIGNDIDYQTLTASLYGNDTLQAGNGMGDTLIAGEGVDTLIGGTGAGSSDDSDNVIGDNFIAAGGLAPGSLVQGMSGSDTLTAGGDISGATILNIGTLITGSVASYLSGALVANTSISLTNTQWDEFITILGVPTEAPGVLDGGTVNAATGGIYDLAFKDPNSTDIFNMTALSDDGTTLIGNDGYGEILTASPTGDDTLEAGNGEADQLIAGSGNDTLTAGDGEADQLTAGDGNDTLTAGNGESDTLTAGAGVDTLTGGTGAYDTFVATDGLTPGSVVAANGASATLNAGYDISGATISGISELDLALGDDSITLTAAQFNAFTSIYGGDVANSEFTINAATAGTYNLATADANVGLDMTALSDGGTTLIGNNAYNEILTASDTGNDTLEAGNGESDQLIAGGGVDSLVGSIGNSNTFVAGNGVDTIIGDTGGLDSFVAEDGLAPGSVVEGQGDYNVLYADGDISGATITGIVALELTGDDGVTLSSTQFSEFGDIILSSTQFSQFGSIVSNPGSGAINAATAGTYDLAAQYTGQETISLTALSDGGTTLIGNNGTAEILTASDTGNDTLEAGDGAGDKLIGGGGNDTLIGGTGADTFILTGLGNTINIVIAGNAVTFTGTGEQIVFSDPDTVIVQNGAQGTVIGSDGTLTVNNDATGNLIQSTTNWNAGGSEIQTFTTLPDGSIQEESIGYTGSNGTGTQTYDDVTTLCFLKGTHILTPSGERAVEDLRVGEEVVTLRGAARRIVWVGEGRVLAARGRRSAATPVIVRKGALADNLPHRDLRVTKAHGLYIDHVFIPVEFLVNHRLILWDDHAQEVHLYHIELETHDVLLANGAPAESYRDDGNRWLFQNANSGWGLPPQEPYAPVLTGGPIVDAAWRRLLDRAGPRPGMPTTEEPDLYLLADGRRVDAAARNGMSHIFRLPQPPATARIVSRCGVPQELGLARDPRPLGVALRRIMVTQGARVRSIEAADALLTVGFHGFEADNDIRWTDGDAAMPAGLFDGFAGPLEIALSLGGRTTYVDDGALQRVA